MTYIAKVTPEGTFLIELDPLVPPFLLNEYLTLEMLTDGEEVDLSGFDIIDQYFINGKWFDTRMSVTTEEFRKDLDKRQIARKKERRMVFGLQPKDIAIIEAKLDNNYSHEDRVWKQIGIEIGWCYQTARYYYINHLRKKLASVSKPCPFC